jgi:uncharacterized glyoxalase superfamily protein PhnB
MSTPKPTVSTEIFPYIFYRDVPAALDWLSRAFGFTEEMRHATPGGMHAQMRCALRAGTRRRGRDRPPATR